MPHDTLACFSTEHIELELHYNLVTTTTTNFCQRETEVKTSQATNGNHRLTSLLSAAITGHRFFK